MIPELSLIVHHDVDKYGVAPLIPELPLIVHHDVDNYI